MGREKIEKIIHLSELVLSHITPTHFKYSFLSSIHKRLSLLTEIEDVDVETWADSLILQLEHIVSQKYSVESLSRLTIPSPLSGLDHKCAFTVSGDYCLNV